MFGEQPSAAKWNIIGTNMAGFNDGTAIGTSSITPEKLVTGTGATWTPASWTPTLSGRFDDADWTKTSTFIQVGKEVLYEMKLVATAAAPMGGGTVDAIFSLPVTAVNLAPNADSAFNIGCGGVTDDSANVAFFATVIFNTTTTARIKVHGAGGTYLGSDPISSTAPFTWTTSDEITVSGRYPAA